MEHYYFEVEVKKNEVPSFTKTTPVKESTVEFTYTFTGWDKTILSVIGNEKYVAQYSINSYTITYYLDGGTNNDNNPSTYTVELDTIYIFDPIKDGKALIISDLILDSQEF